MAEPLQKYDLPCLFTFEIGVVLSNVQPGFVLMQPGKKCNIHKYLDTFPLCHNFSICLPLLSPLFQVSQHMCDGLSLLAGQSFRFAFANLQSLGHTSHMVLPLWSSL